ncbi:MAG: type 1 glutamine amidotransferase [Actinophytocola sp.]|uniref:type 1 glutamine amidotransferase n=1 Tax=Actinophytocola sp. TaxID=1872138 RepID=UPI00132C72B4|nr:type 1 glutamine amidotransferase [Actinophytocola sp.]MPZ81636.1 type 1 glutamine amidotransferase [Actinophytocola sp.]
MTRLLVIQPDPQDPVGPLGDWLTGAGAELHILAPPADPLPADLHGYAGLVVLGGAMGALDDLDHPWLADIRRLLSNAVSKQLPTLAVCLGAQLLAVAAGGSVTVGEEGPEVGPQLVAKRDIAWTDPLFADLPLVPDVLHFHSDVVDRLPPNSALLASATRYPNQAFRVGRCGYGLQFHIETTTDIVRLWARDFPREAEFARPGDLTAERLDELHADLAETWRPVATQFVRLAAGDLAPADSARTQLPLLGH